MFLDEAVDLVLFAFEHGENGDLLIQKAPACMIQTQAEAVCKLFGGKKEDIRKIGIRHGEKMYETMLPSGKFARKDLFKCSCVEYVVNSRHCSFYELKGFLGEESYRFHHSFQPIQFDSHSEASYSTPQRRLVLFGFPNQKQLPTRSFFLSNDFFL